MFFPRRDLSIITLSVLLLAAAPGRARSQEAAQSTDGSLQAGEQAAAATPVPRRSPAKAPHVTCQGGQLQIVAENSTMSSIFSAIHDCIGVAIEMPRGFSDDRTFISVGPGPARQVLNEFLSETDFNYVIQSSTSKERSIESIQLTVRPRDARDGRDALLAGNLIMTPARRAWLANRNAGRPVGDPPEGVDDSAGADTGSSAMDNPPAAIQEEGAAALAATATVEAKDQTAAPAGASAPSTGSQVSDAGTPTTAAAPSAADSSGTNPGAAAPSALQKQINQMEQMFEERKQMIAKPAAPAAADPN